ncbi:DUF2249 domain-containing protein [Mesorhizobium sp. B3-1-7]|nr:DUF2249 domain-containing protein [Mesorhizobium sp. B3-1-7]TPJ37100.1 DUF2249 domain-containing protein [Mesorhizobium sp. B2-8-3]
MSESQVSSQPQLDVRAVPPVERHARIFGIAQALAGGQSFVIVNDHNPQPHPAGTAGGHRRHVRR